MCFVVNHFCLRQQIANVCYLLAYFSICLVSYPPPIFSNSETLSHRSEIRVYSKNRDINMKKDLD